MRLLVIGNPENRRLTLLTSAAERLGWSLQVVAYEKLLQGNIDLESIAADCDAVRIDSPGENFCVERLLIARGANRAEPAPPDFIDADAALSLREELGRIYYPYQYYLGFASLLEELDRRLPNARWMNAPSAIKCMFDKTATTAALQCAGVPVPMQYGKVDSYDHLIAMMQLNECPRVFAKLATSSSASGVVAIVKRGDHLQATTTVELEIDDTGQRMYNTLRLRHLTGADEIEVLINSLAPHRLIAEAWIPKAAYDHRTTFDMRVVVIDGVPTHFVPRVSASPMTNLHLGNRRGDWQIIRNRLGKHIDAFMETCIATARAIPGAFYTGLDVVIDPSFQKFTVLEANACGDLLPGILDGRGSDTYSAELTRFTEIMK